MTSKLEIELVKASGFKPPKGGYDDRQDHLAALAKLANKLDDKAFDELTDDAANWVTAAIHSIRDKEEIAEFDDADQEQEAEDDHESDAAAESENEAEEAAEEIRATKRKDSKGAGAAGKAKAQKSTKGHKPLAKPEEEKPAKKERVVITRYDNIDGSKDRFGIVKGTKTADAVQMYTKGCTTTEIKNALGGRYYNILKVLEDRGHRVERFPGGKFLVTHKADIEAKKKAKKNG